MDVVAQNVITRLKEGIHMFMWVVTWLTCMQNVGA
jgi:hypothetical protein